MVTSKFSLKECASVPQLFILSSEGEKVRDVDLQIKESLTDMRIYVLQNGGFLLASTGKFYLLDSEGKLINQETNSELNGTLLCCGGKWYALMPKYTADGEEAYLQEIDTKEGKLVGDPIKTDNKIFFVSQGENDCFMLNVNGIDKYDPITNTSTQVMSWKDTDVNSSNLSMLGGRISSEDEMVFFQMKLMDTEDRTSMDMKAGGATSWSVVKLTKADKNPHAGKTVLKLGVTGTTDPDFVEKVIAYNLDTENTARIEICDYSTETGVSMSDEDYRKVLNDSVNRLNMDMLSGNGPDILVGFSDMSQFNYDSMLLDLNPMLDADTRINRADYFDNIFRSFETDGKLYSIPLTFTVEGYAVNSKYSGAKENWTFSDFDQMASALPETVQLLHSDSCDELLRAWMLSLSSHFIDNENKTVNFESEEFKALLETVKKYGKSSGLSNANMPGSMEGFALNDDILFLDDMVASCSVSLSDMQFYAMYQHNNDDKIIFSGVPSLSGTSMAASGQLSMSITTSSPNPELAWDFISDFLSEETQHIISFNTGTFPVNRNAFMKNCGLEIEINNQMIEELRKDAEASPEKVGDLSLILELSQTQADELATLISSVSSSQSYDKDVLDIVLEEAAGFFAGQRTIEDVCKNIQNRASIIVQER